VIIGGREDKDSACDILARIAKRASGGKLVLATFASEEPDRQWARYKQTFQRLGAKKLVRFDYTAREDAISQPKLDLLDGAAAVFFTGGDQLKLVSKIAGTPALERIVELYDSGATIAGTSAGAAAMSETMIVGAAEDTHKIGSAFRTASGLGLVKDIIIDQHFAQRWRIGRLLGAVAEKPSALGIGIDEDTAIELDGDAFQVIGGGAVYVVDGRSVTYTNMSEEAFDRTMAIFDIKLHVLKTGNSFDLTTRRPALGSGADTTVKSTSGAAKASDSSQAGSAG
jgi:cyanophycinase